MIAPPSDSGVAPAGSALPLRVTPIVGRTHDLRALLGAVAAGRLVTLVGPGGVGKSRLALAVAAEVRAQGSAPVFWVDLAPVGADALAAHAVADVLGVRETSRPDLVEAIAAALGDRPALLVLDNCEHLAAACAAAAHGLLVRCPRLQLLATSREALGVDGERRWPVPPLSVPPGAGEATAALLAESEAVQLFSERAQAVRPDFRVSDANAAAVRHVCRSLDGLPLGLELAAARLRTHSVVQVAAGIDDALGLLVGGARSAPQRQRTLRATLDWSHALLTHAERAAFRRLAVFAGSFSLDAAQRVVEDGDATGADLLDTVTQLVDKSLVAVEPSDHAARFRMLMTVRQYGLERLEASGERAAAERRLVAWMGAVAERLEPWLTGARQAAALEQLDLELPNLRTALEVARATADADWGLRIGGAVWRYWYLRGLYQEGRTWLDWAVVTGDAAPAPQRARALWGGGMLALVQCDYPGATRRLEASLLLYRDAGDRAGVARLLQTLGSAAREQGRYARAEELHQESLKLFQELGDRWGVASARGYLGFAAWLQGDHGRAERECGAALDVFRDLGEAEGSAWALLSLGVAAQYRGELERARRLLGESRALAERIGFREGVAWAAHELGLVALRQRDPAAETLLREGLAIHRELGDRWRTASVLEDLAQAAVAAEPPRPERAARLLGAAQAVRDEIGTTLAPCERDDHARTEAAIRRSLDTDRFTARVAAGRTGPLDDVLDDVDLDPSRAAAAAEPVPREGAGPPAPALRIRALGAATVELDSRRLVAADWGYAKPRELCFLLLSSPALSKERIGLALWPDLGEAALRNALHTALRQLRRALGAADWVVFRDGGYRWNRSRPGEVDLHVFELELDAAGAADPPSAALPHLLRALAAYGGDFLEGLDAGEWAEPRRQELRRSLERALAAAGGLLAEAGRHDEAAQVYQRAIEHEPLDEGAHRGLMAAWAAAGQTARALGHYRGLTRLLADELGVAPAPETADLAARLQRAD